MTNLLSSSIDKSRQMRSALEDAADWRGSPFRACVNQREIFWPTCDGVGVQGRQPGGTKSSNPFEVLLNEKAKQAIRLCNVCPYEQRCLEFALDNNLNKLDDGVMGGMTPDQRITTKRHLRRARVKAEALKIRANLDLSV